VSHSLRRETVAGVPVLLAMPAQLRGPVDTPPPIVLWLHGFRADAAANAAELQAFAADGFLGVGVDAVDHGARRAADLDARVAAAAGGARALMLALAAATAAELPALVAALGARGLGDAERVGIVGVSMGGYLAYRAAGAVPGVRAVVAVLGSPEWGDPGSSGADSPHHDPEAFRHVALLSITAEHDASVPPDAARRLHAVLAADHPAPARSRYVELPGAGHLVGAEEWSQAMDEARGWMRAHLAPAAPPA
jgi:pimeloyl-ACP methyl ester carboxylesterase